MDQEVANMEAFKGGPSQAFQVLNPQDDNLSDGIGSSYGVINYKGKVWSLRFRGEKKTFVRPDDGTPQSFIDVVILSQAKVKSKSYFKQYDPSGTSEGDRPICASLNGVIPDADVQQKQAEACSICPRNIWKTDANGRKGRDCQDYKRLAVLLLPNQTKALLGEALIEPVFLRVPPASLNNLALMGEQMAAQGYHYSSYITRITFDPAEAHPKMIFRALQPLTEKEAPVVLPLRTNPVCSRITGADQEQLALAAPAQPTQAPPANPTPPAQPAPAVASQPETIDTGFTVPATVGTVSSPPPPEGSAQTIVADTGEPGEADAALDERIAKLMPTQ